MSFDLYGFTRFLTVTDVTWEGRHHNARVLVRCLKGESFNGYFVCDVDGVRTRINKENPDPAFNYVGEMIGTGLNLQPSERYYLCCIPDSKCTVRSGRPSKVERLALATVRYAPQLQLWDGIRFKRQMPKSSETNERDAAVLYGAMQLIAAPPTDGVILLLDDVCTTGAHFRAAAALLKANGVRKIAAICAARTTHNSQDRSFGKLKERMDEFNP